MGIATAKFSDGIYFTNQKGRREKNDFYINFFVSGKLKDNTIKKDKFVHAYILGLERLFKNDDSLGTTMENFAKAFNKNGNDGCEVAYESNTPYGNALVVSFASDIIKENMSVTIQLSEKYEFTAEFKDKDAIRIVVHFDDFNVFFDDLPQNIPQEHVIIANELAYVDDFAAIDSKRNRVKTVLKGEWVEISWSVGNVEKVSASLSDENGVVVANEPSYKEQINEDRKFTLNLEKDGHIVTQILSVNQISPVEVVVYNEDGERWWYNGDPSTNNIERITWSGKNIEKCDVSLYDENGVVVAKESPYIYRVNQYKSSGKLFTLKIERDDCVITKKIPVGEQKWVMDTNYFKLKHEWFKHLTINFFDEFNKSKNVIDLKNSLIDGFKLTDRFTRIYPTFWGYHPLPDEKGSNLFFYTTYGQGGFLIYIHPDIWFFDTFFGENKINYLWKKLSSYDKAPKWNDIKCYKTSACSNDKFLICITLKDRIAIRRYKTYNNPWDHEITIEKKIFDKYADKDKDGEFLFCQTSSSSNGLYAVYQHAIYWYSFNYDGYESLHEPSLKWTMPEDAKEANIVSISNCGDCGRLAILCDNNYVYKRWEDKAPHSLDNGSIYLEHIKNPKDIILYDSNTIIVDGYVIKFDENGSISNQDDAFFSPKQTIEYPENMFFGIYSDQNKKTTKALTWDQKGKNFWSYIG